METFFASRTSPISREKGINFEKVTFHIEIVLLDK